MHTHRTTRPSLGSWLFAFVSLTALCAGSVLLLNGEARLDRYETEVLKTVAEKRAQATAMIFARSLHSEWARMSAIAQGLSEKPFATRRAELDLLVEGSERVSWAGLAILDGTVTVASNGLLEGQSVATRPWFQRGLEGHFAGDVHEAVLLAEKLGPLPSGAPRRFLDLATPVAGPDGGPSAVLGLHISEDWARGFLLETAGAVGVEAAIVSRDGTVAIGSHALREARFDLPSIQAAVVGAGGAVLERWPDGREWLTAVVPQVGYADLPPFGWSLIARIDPETFAAERQGLSSAFLAALGALAGGLVLLTLLFVRFFLNPIAALASTAHAIAEGNETYPFESRRSREGSLLSSALARIEKRLVER